MYTDNINWAIHSDPPYSDKNKSKRQKSNFKYHDFSYYYIKNPCEPCTE